MVSVIIEEKTPILGIPTEEAFIFINGGTASKQWYLQIKDTSTGKRHRFSLGNQCRGIDGKREAVIEGGKRYISYMAKMERGEQLRSLSTGEMCRRFLEKEKGRISNVPHKGITQTRYRFLENHVDKFLEFVGGANIDVTKIRRERFHSYPEWRREWARKKKKHEVTENTIRQELSTIKRIFTEIAYVDRYIQSIPTFPTIRIKGTEGTIRRDHFTAKEYELFIKRIRARWAFPTQGAKNEKSTRKGKIYEIQLVRQRVNGKWVSNPRRAPIQYHVSLHRKIIYYAVLISANSMMRIGSLQKIQWKHIRKNNLISKEEQQIFCLVDVPAENTKTARGYIINAPLVEYFNQIRKISKYTNASDYVFCNQRNGKPFSRRVWVDYWDEMLVAAEFAEWRMRPRMEDGTCTWDEREMSWKINGIIKESTTEKNHACCEINKWAWVKDNKNLTWYSMRHTAITFRIMYGKGKLSPLVLAQQANTSVKYIETHYYHHDAQTITEEINAGRKFLRESSMNVDWMDEQNYQ